MEKIRGYFRANIDINGTGAIIASPDASWNEGAYLFHWERDGSLTMQAMGRTDPDKAYVKTTFQNYVKWVTKVQNQKDPNGIDILAEPKYTIPSGVPFTGGWCRPQKDGPALRSLAVARYALGLFDENDLEGLDWVKTEVFGGPETLVQKDLAWLMQHWQDNTCDLWEDHQATDFFWGRFASRAALTVGATLAEKLGESSLAAQYKQVADQVTATLSGHWTGQYVTQTADRPLDGAVIDAFNVGYLDDGVFGPLSKEVLGTVKVFSAFFCGQYPINRADAAANVPGIMYGRYKGDVYVGGNPWILLTAALAQLVYRTAAEVAQQSSVDSEIYGMLVDAYQVDENLSTADLAEQLMGAGDGIMLRIRHHVEGADFHMWEQLEKNSGDHASAGDLTWNYANVLSAMQFREKAQQAMAQEVVV